MTPRGAALAVLLAALTGATAGVVPASDPPGPVVPGALAPVPVAPVPTNPQERADVDPTPAPVPPPSVPPPPPVPVPVLDLSASTTPVGPTMAEPVTLDVPAIAVAAAPVVPVGVLADGRLEVPGPGSVGWYRYGPRPGGPGSAVLAAHVAYGGVAGPFLRLGALAVDDEITVAGSGGEVTRWRVTSVERVDKTALPGDRLFARDGPPVLTLITCGGDFDAAAGSFRQNIVVRAAPQ